jgi:hypothetical protein
MFSVARAGGFNSIKNTRGQTNYTVFSLYRKLVGMKPDSEKSKAQEEDDWIGPSGLHRTRYHCELLLFG